MMPQGNDSNLARAVPARDADELTPGMRLNRHGRYRRHSHSRRHHRENCRKLAAFEDDLGAYLRFMAGSDQAVAKAVAFLQEQKRLAIQVRQAQALLVRAAMFFRKHRKELLLEQLDGNQFSAR